MYINKLLLYVIALEGHILGYGSFPPLILPTFLSFTFLTLLL